MSGTKRVYLFSEGNASMKDLLGGKGANLAEMTNIGLPVPPGFTITTAVCNEYYALGRRFPDGLMDEVQSALKVVEEQMGKRLGDPDNPLLVSVRSGAKFSMPGMMDTVLNLGLNSRSLEGLIKQTGNERFAYDAYRRFIMMFSDIVLDVARKKFEAVFDEHKKRLGVQQDTDVPAGALQQVCADFLALARQETGSDFPGDPLEQLRLAIEAVFRSWDNDRAIVYRNREKIAHDLGTAVNVQAMVFGNMGDDSGTGVAFTRDMATGERVMYGEYLMNAQGEDVVAGVRTPIHISQLEADNPAIYKQFEEIANLLERHYRDAMDLEFTIEKNRLFILQCRVGKRTAAAAVKIAVDMTNEGLISQQEALHRVRPQDLDQLLHRQIDPHAQVAALTKGLAASPGAAAGKVVFESETAELRGLEEPVILVRPETNPDDIGGMVASKGVLTARGGMTCVAGDTQVLTDRGLLTAEAAFGLLEAGEALRILSFDSRTLQPVWRSIIAAGRRASPVVTIALSQTGRAEQNTLRMTPDHKMFTLQNRKLQKKRLDAVLAEEDFLTVVDRIPSLGETAVPPTLAYVAGAIFSDGYVHLSATKGYVTFTQRPTPEKADFIAAVEQAFEQAFNVSFTYARERTTVGNLRGRTIRGTVEDRISFRRDPAARLVEIRENLSAWLLTLDRTALLHFLAGFVDGDGIYAEESSAIHLQICVSHAKKDLMEGLALACLRLGIVPQISNNHDNYLVQITEQVEDILAFTRRVRADIPPCCYESKCLSVKALFGDMVGQVNHMGRVREGVKRNLLFGVEKLRRDILPLCPGETYRETQALLDAPLRSYRVMQVAEAETTLVYNFEVDASEDLDKNFVVFSSRLTPVLVSNSHAAVVARGFGIPCVAGCESIEIDEHAKVFHVNGTVVKEGDFITIDGSTGQVILGEAPLVEPVITTEFETLLRWADETRRLKVRANADNPKDAGKAFEFGAEGIGLCRTEHMFFEKDRLPIVQDMILATEEADRRSALNKLLPVQQSDFEGIFEAMQGRPVTIRLIDPPLHEFLPRYEEVLARVVDLKARGVVEGTPSYDLLAEQERLLRAIEGMREQNPMLGLRGCRLSIIFPEIVEMQVRAIFQAAVKLHKRGEEVHPEIMIPLVGHVNELKLLRDKLEGVAKQVMQEQGCEIDYQFGTMIEIPRAALTSDEIAEFAEFFSFGTNDLTQTTFGFSRDDAEGKFLQRYVDQKILPTNPFESLDTQGVGRLMRICVEQARPVRPNIKLGICGEHGGDPDSIAFCHAIGLDYVSCSPFRVPIARLAAAQAALGYKGPGDK